jgi:hypothetical protein
MMRTTATYEPSSKTFVLHTPDFHAAKCWIGNLGKIKTIIQQITCATRVKAPIYENNL